MDPKTIRTRLQELAFLNSDATIWFRAIDSTTPQSSGNGAGPHSEPEWEKLHFDGGLCEYVKYLNRDSQPMHEPIFITDKVGRIWHVVHQFLKGGVSQHVTCLLTYRGDVGLMCWAGGWGHCGSGPAVVQRHFLRSDHRLREQREDNRWRHAHRWAEGAEELLSCCCSCSASFSGA